MDLSTSETPTSLYKKFIGVLEVIYYEKMGIVY
jgi:hypothetical protein